MLRTLELKTAEPVYLSGGSRQNVIFQINNNMQELVSKSKFKKRFPVVQDILLKGTIDYTKCLTKRNYCRLQGNLDLSWGDLHNSQVPLLPFQTIWIP